MSHKPHDLVACKPCILQQFMGAYLIPMSLRPCAVNLLHSHETALRVDEGLDIPELLLELLHQFRWQVSKVLFAKSAEKEATTDRLSHFRDIPVKESFIIRDQSQ